MRRPMTLLVTAMIVLATLIPSAVAQPASFPDVIPLPDGFAPEGIAIPPGHTFYVGSIPTGAIYRGNLATGEGSVLVEPIEGRSAIGLAVALRRFLLVAGGATGDAYVYNTRTGAPVAEYDLATGTSFVNDVTVTADAAYFTDSFAPVLYRVPLPPTGSQPETLPLTGDFTFVPGAFNTNGIVATPSGTLIIVNATTGELYSVDPDTGETELIDLGGETLVFGDGLLLDGMTLYVVQNQLNQIAVVELSPGLETGEVVAAITDPDFDVPTTIADFRDSIYAVNARFGTPVTPETDYSVVRVDKP